MDSPRVSNEYIQEMAMRYGEDSNVYRIRVVGEFPKGDDDTVIAMELLESALNRDVAPSEYAPMIWGLDVARFGSDRSALCKRQGNAVTENIKTWKNLDLMQLTGAVVAEYQALAPSQQPKQPPSQQLNQPLKNRPFVAAKNGSLCGPFFFPQGGWVLVSAL